MLDGTFTLNKVNIGASREDLSHVEILIDASDRELLEGMLKKAASGVPCLRRSGFAQAGRHFAMATGNVLPATVPTICVDINPAVPTKLSDRGSFQAVGLIMDSSSFLRELAQELGWKG